MKIIKKIADMQTMSAKAREQDKTVALVPTMGALHEGQLKLVDTARSKSDLVVVSIFVNQLQFGPGEDYIGYPRDLGHDAELIANRGADILFAPDAHEMYTPHHSTYIDVSRVTSSLCGRSRPGHFRGVCTVVCKLFNIVNPDIAVFGEKDIQQVTVIKTMVEQLNMNVRILTIPTVRENDGLAMSSRNAYLSSQERNDAAIVYQSLLTAQNLIRKGERSAGKIREKMKTLLCSKSNARVDYVEVVGSNDLQPLEIIDGEVVIAVAVWFGKARLIDNITIESP
jgi:pantoate--beta-alanine ligase